MNETFIKRMKSYIPDEMEAFLASFDMPLRKGLSLNTKKLNKEDFEEWTGLSWNQSIFSRHSSIVEDNLGLHPAHICGAFYLQEPSASAPISALNIQGEEVVLDMCAAPGGKSMQIASLLETGFLLSNEINHHRAQILLSNMERLGFENVAISNDTPKNIAKCFPEIFDKVLVDTPCSGEGMMHKHQEALDQWSLDLIDQCQARQKEILDCAIQALKPGGTLVYSTCTYAKEENEDIISWALETYPNLKLEPISTKFGRDGFIEGTRRIFPMDGGEGQFMACLKKEGNSKNKLKECQSDKPSKIMKEFLDDQLEKGNYYYLVNKDKIWIKQSPFYELKGIKVLRQGNYVGQEKKNRLEPTHSFYMASSLPLKKKVSCSLQEMNDFMHGLEIEKEGIKGYVGLVYKDLCFGFGKASNGKIKNKIPKGLRLLEKSQIQK